MAEIRYDIHNPGLGVRVIHDGLQDQKQVTIPPGGTKTGVPLSDAIADRLKKVQESDKTGRELILTPSSGSSQAPSVGSAGGHGGLTPGRGGATHGNVPPSTEPRPAGMGSVETVIVKEPATGGHVETGTGAVKKK